MIVKSFDFKEGDIVRIPADYAKIILKSITSDNAKSIIPEDVLCSDGPLNQYVRGRILGYDEISNTARVIILKKNKNHDEAWLVFAYVPRNEMTKEINLSIGNYDNLYNQAIESLKAHKMTWDANKAVIEEAQKVKKGYSMLTHRTIVTDLKFNQEYNSVGTLKGEFEAPIGDTLCNIFNDYHGITGLTKALQEVIDSVIYSECNKVHIQNPLPPYQNSENKTNFLKIDRVIFNDPATIIFWKSWHWEEKVDDTTCPPTITKFKVQDKTIVKCSEGETFNKYNGFCAAVTKHIFETNSNVHRIIQNAQDDSDYVNIKPRKKTSSKTSKKGGTKKNG